MIEKYGAPGTIRTSDPQIRSLRPNDVIVQLLCKLHLKRPIVFQSVTGASANYDYGPPAENGTAVPAGPRNGGNHVKANGAFEDRDYRNALATASVGGAA